jgi:RNA polymerase sigma-70 factor (ECF subfamily)
MSSRFATTSWTQVLAARDAPSSESRQALEGLCNVYWYPLYVFVRRQGHAPEEARDLTQGYFAQLLEKGYLEDFDPALGRFRVFLKASVKNFLSKERDKAHALKRGGKARIVSLDADDVEGRYRYEPVDKLTPEEIFERRWALTFWSAPESSSRSSRPATAAWSSKKSRATSPARRSGSLTASSQRSSEARNRR